MAAYAFEDEKRPERGTDLHGISHFGHIMGKDKKYVAIFDCEQGYKRTDNIKTVKIDRFMNSDQWHRNNAWIWCRINCNDIVSGKVVLAYFRHCWTYMIEILAVLSCRKMNNLYMYCRMNSIAL